MRLVCSNCDAEYEVDDSAIPLAGRDVQCSNCGHAWFQTHPDIEAEQAAEAALYEPPAAVAPPEPKPVPPAEAAAVAVPEPEFEDEPAAPLTPQEAVAATLSASAAAAPIAPSRALDESVLAVLREEAAREAAARKSDSQPGLETQTEMGLNAADGAAPASALAAAAVRRIARLKGGVDPEPPPVPKTRREMLPAIEEINSTLRATSDRHSDEENAVYDTMLDLNPKRSGFGRGFVMLVVLAIVVVALYLAAPMIGQRFPALTGPAQTYVAAVDAVRVWVDTEIKALITTLRGYEGGQAG